MHSGAVVAARVSSRPRVRLHQTIAMPAAASATATAQARRLAGGSIAPRAAEDPFQPTRWTEAGSRYAAPATAAALRTVTRPGRQSADASPDMCRKDSPTDSGGRRIGFEGRGRGQGGGGRGRPAGSGRAV